MQSFSDIMLKNIGRTHTAEECVNAFKLARIAGFKNINLDLMYGLPGQDAANWEKSLQQAVSLNPEHISVYELTIEPGTPFAELVSQERFQLPAGGIDLEELENDLIRQAVERAGNNQAEAARLLGVTRGKFRTMMKQSQKK